MLQWNLSSIRSPDIKSVILMRFLISGVKKYTEYSHICPRLPS